MVSQRGDSHLSHLSIVKDKTLTQKICPRCNESKPIDAFAWRNKANGIRKRECRQCCSKQNSAYYHERGGREKHRKAYLINRQSRLAYMRSYERKPTQSSRYDALKSTAHIAVYRAMKSGKLIRPDRCESCDRKCKPEAHHHKGYDKENRLSVQWLCRSCHDKADHPVFAELQKEI